MIDYAATAARVRHDVRQAAFTLREWLLIESILLLSLDRGAPAARIPSLSDFADLTGITKGNVAWTLDRLRQKQVLVIRAPIYRLLPQAGGHQWQVSPRMDPARAQSAAARLLAIQTTEQGELLPPEPDLAEARQAVCLESVPESGTPYPNRERTRIGYDPAKSWENAHGVPESGTVIKCLSVQRFNASTKEHLNDEQETLTTGPAVPESGTEQRLMERIAAAVGQDEMARWGADWRKNWVRRIPDRVEAALDELEYKLKTGWRPRNAGAALKDLVKRFSKGG